MNRKRGRKRGCPEALEWIRLLREFRTELVPRWEDGRKYGFITGGHGEWYHRTMGKAAEGKRIFVNHPGEGYIGVGIVTQEKTPAPEFIVDVEGEEEEIPITEAPLEGDLSKDSEDPDLREYLIGVDWIETRDIEDAFWEKGYTQTRIRLLNYETSRHLTDSMRYSAFRLHSSQFVLRTSRIAQINCWLSDSLRRPGGASAS